MARVDDLKHRVSELERQLQETKQEVNTHTCRHTIGETVACMVSLCFYWERLAALKTARLFAGGDGTGLAAGGEACRAGTGGC